MQLLILLLLVPAALLLLTAAYHLLASTPNPPRSTLSVLARGLRRNLPRAAFGLPPLPRRLSVRASTFLSLCAAASVSLACGMGYLVLATSTSRTKTLSASASSLSLASTSTLRGTHGGELGAGAAALLAGSVFALPCTGVVIGAVGVFLRLTNKLPSSPDSTNDVHPQTSLSTRLRRLLGSEGHLTHIAVLRASTTAALLTATLVGVCAGLPEHAGLILLVADGILSAGAVGVGIAGWRSRGRELGEKFEAAAKYGESSHGTELIKATAVSFARKSRELLRSRENVDLSGSNNVTSDSFLSDPNQTSAHLLLDADFEHILPPHNHEIYATPVAARSEVSRARAELAAAGRVATPERGRRSWEPPVGSPSSWVTERQDRASATLPEWDFRNSVVLPGQHRRGSSSFTTRTMAALGLGSSPEEGSKSKMSKDTTGDSFHTAASAANPGHRTVPSSSSVHTLPTRRRSLEPGSAGSQRPDGSVVGVLEPSPFDPLPPHNFSSIAKLSLPRSVGDSEAGVANMPTLVGATLADGRMLALLDHGEHVAVYDYSNNSTSGSDTKPRPSRRRPADIAVPMRSTRTVNTLPTIPDAATPTSPWPADIDTDTEWVPVDAPAAAESWRRADGVCGILAVVGLVLCFVSPHSNAH